MAHYADLILKKKGPEEVGDKIDEIIKCLEFVAEKDIFQSKFRQRNVIVVLQIYKNISLEERLGEPVRASCQLGGIFTFPLSTESILTEVLLLLTFLTGQPNTDDSSYRI